MANNNLKKLRLSNGLTQKDVTEKLKMTTSAYAKIERGERNLTINAEKKLANLFNVDIETINSLYTKQATLQETSLDL